MIETVFRGDGLPAPERFECWREMAFASHSPHAIHTEHVDHFTASLRVLDLGGVQMSAFTSPPLTSDRTPGLIRRSDPEILHFSLPQRGYMRIAQAEWDATIGTGDLLVISSSHPYRSRLESARTPVAANEFLIPRSMLPLPPSTADAPIALRASARSGLGALLSQFLTHLLEDSAGYGASDAPRLSAVAVDLAAALLLPQLGPPPAPETHLHALTACIAAFIDENLDDPALSPGLIATAHHISLRSLHRLFHGQGTTVGACIRRRRLEGARRDLLASAPASRPIHAIAARWGFRYPADFTRAFRTAYGATPSDYRHAAQRQDRQPSRPPGTPTSPAPQPAPPAGTDTAFRPAANQ